MLKKILSFFRNEYNRTVYISSSPSKIRSVQNTLNSVGISNRLYVEDRLNSSEFPIKPISKVQVKKNDYELAIKTIHDNRL